MRKKTKAIVAAMAAMSLTMAPLTANAQWQQSGSSWWNTNNSAQGYSIGWEFIGSNWYYFDNAGWMKTGWVLDQGSWYYMDDSGAMKNGWIQVGNVWYYMSGSGAMSSSTWIGDYYVNANGAMVTNAWVGNYYVGADGKYIPGYQDSQHGGKGSWQQTDGKWWFKINDGSYAKDGFYTISDVDYYFDAAGYMVTGWFVVKESEYYAYPDGHIAMSETIDGKYVSYEGQYIPGYAVNHYPTGSYKVDADIPAGSYKLYPADGYAVSIAILSANTNFSESERFIQLYNKEELTEQEQEEFGQIVDKLESQGLLKISTSDELAQVDLLNGQYVVVSGGYLQK